MEENKVISQKINALQNQITYLKSKRSIKCKKCGKEFTPYSLKEKYCSDTCRSQAIKEYKHKNYLKNKQNPELVEKNKKYLIDWRRRTGVVKSKDSVPRPEYDRLLTLFNNLNERFDAVVAENKRLIIENHELRNKSFLSKLKDLF